MYYVTNNFSSICSSYYQDMEITLKSLGSQGLMVKDNIVETEWFVPELTEVCKLSVIKYLMLSSEKQMNCVTVCMV